MFIHNPTLCCQLAKKADYTHHAAARFITVLPSDHMSSCGLRLLSGSSSGCRVFATTPPLLPSERAIMSQFLLFVITVLLIASGNYARSTVSSKGVFPAPRKSQEEDKPMMPKLRKLLYDDEGQDIAEYAVMLAVILVIVVGTIRLVGSHANTVFSNAASSIQ